MTLLLILVLTSTVCIVESDSHDVTVRPTDSDPSVCGDHTSCDTLSNLLSDNSTIFSDVYDLLFTFLEGIHTVNYSRPQISIGQKNKVKWDGKDAVIVCKTGLIFIFNSTKHLEIHGLDFSECGNTIHSGSIKLMLYNNISAALFLSNVEVFHCMAMTITRSKGYGLFLLSHLGNAHIQNCSFLYNNMD